jgi:DNA invertase Pin-like site-specific DNA recombinase
MMPHKTQIVAYVRVSSTDQNLARQLEAIGPVDRVFEEKVSGGSRADRTALAECIRYVRDGDVVRVASMDRLARSLRDLRDLVDDVAAKGASVTFVKEQQTYGRDADDAIGQLMLNLLGAFAEFERSLIRERQAEGIRIAKAAGKYLGRAKKLTPAQVEEARELVTTGVPKTVIARKFGVDRATLYRAITDPATVPQEADPLTKATSSHPNSGQGARPV